MTTNNETIKGKWDKHEGQFVASIRCGGRAADLVGRMAHIRSQAGDYTLVTLTRVVVDYGAGDVALFEVSR